MRDRQQDVADPQRPGEVADRRARPHPRPARGVVGHLDVGPAQPLRPAGAQALQDRLLGGPAAGEVLGRVLGPLAVADLALGVDAVEEQLAVAVDHPLDAQALDDVRADADDFHA